MTETDNKDPLHGLTLEKILNLLVDAYGWEGLAEFIPVKCFSVDPSIKSSLIFLRRTPWARAKVEALFLGKLRKRRSNAGRRGAAPPATRGSKAPGAAPPTEAGPAAAPRKAPAAAPKKGPPATPKQRPPDTKTES